MRARNGNATLSGVLLGWRPAVVPATTTTTTTVIAATVVFETTMLLPSPPSLSPPPPPPPPPPLCYSWDPFALAAAAAIAMSIAALIAYYPWNHLQLTLLFTAAHPHHLPLYFLLPTLLNYSYSYSWQWFLLTITRTSFYFYSSFLATPPNIPTIPAN